MQPKKSNFQRHQTLIVDDLKKRGHFAEGRLARRGSKVQELVERLRVNPPSSTIFPVTLINIHGYCGPTVHEALSRMVIAGEAEQTEWGSYQVIAPWPKNMEVSTATKTDNPAQTATKPFRRGIHQPKKD